LVAHGQDPALALVKVLVLLKPLAMVIHASAHDQGVVQWVGLGCGVVAWAMAMVVLWVEQARWLWQ